MRRAAAVALLAALGGACNQIIGATPPIVVQPDGGACALDDDCQSHTCGPGGACLPAACRVDGAVRCGAGCEPCPDFSACDEPADCESLACTPSGLCVPSACSSGGVFVCGEGCEPCPDFVACDADVDCASLTCDPAFGGECVPATCETAPGVFACGEGCSLCGDDAPCDADGDCLSASCRAGRCIPATCFDGQPSGDEEGQDCGGSCFVECSPCTKKNDCPGAQTCCDLDDLGCCSNDAGCCDGDNCACG